MLFTFARLLAFECCNIALVIMEGTRGKSTISPLCACDKVIYYMTSRDIAI